MGLESILMQMEMYMKDNGIKMLNKGVGLLKLHKETFIEDIG